MDRRRFLETTFASGLTLSGSACARAPKPSAPPLTGDELDAKLTRLDKVLARLDHDRTTRWYVDKRRTEFEAAMAASDPGIGADVSEAQRAALREAERLTHEGELLRSSMRVALLVSTVGELPEENHSDERVIERVLGIADEADYALFGTLERLRNLDPSELEQLDAELTADAAPGMDVAGELDELAVELGVPSRRRLHLRRMAKHIDWRLQNERFSTVVSDTVNKVDRMLDNLARAAAEPSATLAFAGPDPGWVARTREVVRFYAPEPPADAGAPAEVQTPSATAPAADPSTAAAAVAPPASPPPASPPPPASSAPSSGALPPATATAPAYELPPSRQTMAAEQAAQKEELLRGRLLLGVGAGLSAFGGLSAAIALGIGFGLSIGGVGLAIFAGIGAAVLTAGIILLVIGAVMTARARRQAKLTG